MRKTELGDTSLREEAIGWYHMTIQKMLVVRQQVVHILETFAGICIIWYRTLELKQRPGCSEDWQTDTHVTKNILSSQTMEHREKALENLYAFFVSNGSYKTGQPDKVQNRGLNQLWAVWQWQGTNALQGLNAMKPWNTEISRRPWSRSIMSSENTLPGPSGRHRLQEQKALEACFPQSRNRIPTHIWALPIWTLSRGTLSHSPLTLFLDRKVTWTVRKKATAKDVTNLPACRVSAKMVHPKNWDANDHRLHFSSLIMEQKKNLPSAAWPPRFVEQHCKERH